MRSGNIIESLARATTLAIERDLPRISYNSKPKTQDPVIKNRRPYEHEVQVYHFEQMWGSTALGFSGMGGSAMTHAYTTVVVCRKAETVAVYFDGRHAYNTILNQKVFVALKLFSMPSQDTFRKEFE